ncbi:MAG: N-acetylmuramoyl-L-alanine amidase, partial [Gammaproteobacteria bacterium]|nr:N-acetylmuramoyl-L-alanine amidase [Gammaproteobacteria bacterium]
LRILAASFVLISTSLLAEGAIDVTAIDVAVNADHTRVVFELSAPVDHRVFSLKDPERVVIDLTGARMNASMPPATGAVAAVRSGKRETGLRIVLDLAVAGVRPRSVMLPPLESGGHRLVVDLVNADSNPVATVVAPPVRRDVLVAIDPGHGGQDPGAVGAKGTYEKNVVMEIARRLKAQVDAQPGMRAILTRDSDSFISHRERMRRAREQRADFFISIHADAFNDKRVRGSSVYALSTRGATSEAAHWLAERENAADLIGGVKLDDKDEMLASVLLDLSQTASISASLKAGSMILTELAKVNQIRRRSVQQANFLVLKSPDIPSVLVETAFISNSEEEKRLRDPAYQDKLAHAILRGIQAYFADYAPPGTLLAKARSDTRTSLR